jgi:uncharacterized RDD family membrane protein YckC
MEVASSYQFCPKCGGKQFGNSVCTPTQPNPVSFPIPPQTGRYPPPHVAPYPLGGVVYASFWRRLGAAIVDGIIVGVPNKIIVLVLAALLGLGESGTAIVDFLVVVILQWLYFALLESGIDQATYGKRWLGMKVTNEFGQRISFGTATGRYFGKLVSTIILLIGYLMVLWTDRRQALHDKMSGTYVIYTGGR